jgi:hypothetical protein
MPDKKELGDVEGCNCINCRLARMESALEKLQESVEFYLEKGRPIPGMPGEGNKMRRK